MANTGVVQSCTARGFTVSLLKQSLLLRNETCTLLLNPDAIHSAWIVRKSTWEGARIALEMLDRDGTLLAAIEGQHRQGRHRSIWATLLDAIDEQVAT